MSQLCLCSDSFWVRRLFNVCGRVSVPQMRKFCLFPYPPRSKWVSSEKMIFFAKICIFCKSIAGTLVQACAQPYSFDGRIKLIIYQIRHELSVTIRKKNYRWRNLYMLKTNWQLKMADIVNIYDRHVHQHNRKKNTKFEYTYLAHEIWK